MQAELEPYQVFTEEEVQKVNELEVTGGVKKSTKAQAELNALLDKGVERFKNFREKNNSHLNKWLRNLYVLMALCYKL